MPANTKHPDFGQPADPNISVWRYIDFPKYVSLLSSSSIFFSRADKFDDEFEGSYTKIDLAFLRRAYGKMTNEGFRQQRLYHRNLKEWIYINCWHANNHESAAMWKLYSESSASIALETTYSSLAEELPDSVFLGVVNYIDYESEQTGWHNILWPFFHKRKSFSHENEVRALINEFPRHAEGQKIGERIENEKIGLTVPVNIDSLIKAVRIAPTSPKWFYRVVQEVTERFGYYLPVKQSDLLADPIW